MKKINYKHTLVRNRKKGFTLIELMVAVSVFVVIMVISMGSVMSIFEANRKSQSLRAVMDNLNYSLEAMTRAIRFGTNYHCDATSVDINNLTTNDCPDGRDSIAVMGPDGQVMVYKLDKGSIVRIISNGNPYSVTSSDVTIDKLTFRVIGSAPFSTGDLFQPRVIMNISGYAGVKDTDKTSFSLQTTVSQRMFDSGTF